MNEDSDKRPLQTLRAWPRAIDPCDDTMEFIHRQGLGNAVWEVIPLPLPARGSIPDGHPRNSRLVDLAVDSGEIDRVREHFVPVGLPLSDVSLVSLSPDTNAGDTRTLLQHYCVHGIYMQQYLRRDREGKLPALLLQWYDRRFKEMLLDERQALNQD